MKTGDRVQIVKINRPAATDKEKRSLGNIGIIRKVSRGRMMLVAYGSKKKWFFEDELEDYVNEIRA